MKTKKLGNDRNAITLFEVLVILAILMILGALLMPALVKTRKKEGIGCVNKQKQVVLAFRIWSGDNNDRFPTQVSTNQGGSMESALSGDVLATFQVMSNEFSTPRILLCPTEKKRDAATNFAWLKRENVSYFVGVDAVETNVQMLLLGDRNITNGVPPRGGLLVLTTNNPGGWTDELHQRGGNISLADGSVQQVSSAFLKAAVCASGVETNRLALP